MKKSDFLCENFQFLVVKFSIYLNRRVFVMWTSSVLRICLHILRDSRICTFQVVGLGYVYTCYGCHVFYNCCIAFH